MAHNRHKARVGHKRRLAAHTYGYAHVANCESTVGDDNRVGGRAVGPTRTVGADSAARVSRHGAHLLSLLCSLVLLEACCARIDGRAHQGVLNGSSPQRQVAVLPCSVEGIHPRIHRGLAEAIVDAGGLVVTEQPPGVQVERWMFASRNRILTGLAPSTVVIQSPAQGGSLISARCARDQNRDVFALWQRGMGVEWAGNRALVADHVAHPVDSIDALWGAMKEDAESRSCRAGQVAAVPEGCREVWSMVDARRAVSWREMLPRFRARAAELDRQLLTLELQGCIRRLSGRSFLRN